jgi:hypothetical protein
MAVRKLADSEDELVRSLQRLLTEGGKDDFLIVSAGDVYVQFVAFPKDKQINCEAVSNDYLPPELHLTVEKVMRLNQLGFADPGDSQTSHAILMSPTTRTFRNLLS